MKAQVRFLDDGQRLHLHHGPIDLIIEVVGQSRVLAYEAAIERFDTILEELVKELKMLRTQCSNDRQFAHPVAKRMQRATEIFLPCFITPMAAVAGSVADEILDAMKNVGGLDKIYVNNGGDVAFHIAGSQTIDAAIASSLPARLHISSKYNFRGVATSGWRGRSQSLGIADSVTVIARNAAIADCAATLIANAVNLPNSPRIRRLPANEVFSDSDLGECLVTTDVGALSQKEIFTALNNGELLANKYQQQRLIGGTMLVLQGQCRQIGSDNIIQTKAGELEYA